MVENALAGENVRFNIIGVMYTKTSNKEGYVILNINLQPGNYIITSEYNGCRVSNDITVLPVLFADNLEMNYKDGSTFNATVLDGQGKPSAGEDVTFNVNGVLYTKTTDFNGIAHLNINLLAGKYIITSSYKGTNVANTITIH